MSCSSRTEMSFLIDFETAREYKMKVWEIRPSSGQWDTLRLSNLAETDKRINEQIYMVWVRPCIICSPAANRQKTLSTFLRSRTVVPNCKSRQKGSLLKRLSPDAAHLNGKSAFRVARNSDSPRQLTQVKPHTTVACFLLPALRRVPL